MAALYHSLFTEQGLALLRESIQNGTKLGITHMSFGDGGGNLPIPDASFTQMIKEVYRVQLNRLAPSKENPNWLEADGVIPSAVGGFNIREVGLWAGDTMVAYANYPPTYKPSGDQGTAQIKTIRIVLQIDNTANFELKIDASVVMATIQAVEDAKQEIYKNTVGSVDSLSALLALKVWEGRTVYVEQSGHYKYTQGIWRNVSIGFGGNVYLDDIVPSSDGSKDCSIAINNAIKKHSGNGVTLIGNPESTYLIQNTIDFEGSYNIALDFNFSTILDDVQGTISSSGGRGNHTFKIYNSSFIKVKKINYNITNTRSNPKLEGIPTIVFWIGGQYLGDKMTSSIEIEDFKTDGHSLDKGMIVAGVGELDGITIKRFSIKNGEWVYGCNFEYGLAPISIDEDLTLTNGRHPYNIYVENFNGENLPQSIGFLRTASCYNAKFFSCTGFNVPNFIHYYSGDRGLSRYSQSVIFELCKSKLDDTVTTPNYGVNIIVTTKDGSTGETLPEWTNRDHQLTIKNCEFIGNYVKNTTGFRFVGSLGKVVVENSIFERYHFGSWTQWLLTSNPNLDSPYTLSFRDCTFKKNKSDVRQIDMSGVLYDHCTFKSKVLDNDVPYQIGLWSLNGNCKGTLFRHCFFGRQNSESILMNIESEGVFLDNNNFDLYSKNGIAIRSTKVVKGRNNITNGKLTSDAETAYRVIGDVKKVKVYTDISNNQSIDFSSSDIWVINSLKTIEKVSGGELGDILTIRSGSESADLTIINNSTNATTDTRLINKSKSTDNIKGLAPTRQYMKFVDGWVEV